MGSTSVVVSYSAPKESFSASSPGFPPEIWLLIVEQGCLNIFDRLKMSHTCKDFRALVGRRWPQEMQKLCPVMRDDVFKALAADSMRHWLCPSRQRLRPFVSSDVPDYEENYCAGYAIRYKNPECTDPNIVDTTCRYIYSRHVQLALKYKRQARLGQPYASYLAKLLRPICGAQKTNLGMDMSMTANYTARPKIVRGRFLVEESTIYCAWSHGNAKERHRSSLGFSDMFGELRWQHLGVCPHLNGFYHVDVLDEDQGDETKPWMTVLHRGIKQLLGAPVPGQFALSCQICATDCKVRCTHDDQGCRKLQVWAWKDLGGEDSQLMERRLKMNGMHTRRRSAPGRVEESFRCGVHAVV